MNASVRSSTRIFIAISIFACSVGASVASAQDARCLLQVLKTLKEKPGSDFLIDETARPASYDAARAEVDRAFGPHGMFASDRENGERIRSAAKAVLSDYEQARKKVPWIVSLDEDHLGATCSEVTCDESIFGDHWLESLKGKKIEILGATGSPVRLKKLGGSRSVVYSTSVNGKKWVIRPARRDLKPEDVRATFRRNGMSGGNISVARRTLLASLLNEDLGLGFAAKSKLVLLRTGPGREEVAVASEFVTNLEEVQSRGAELEDLKQTDEGLYSDLLGSQFFFGQADGHPGNVMAKMREVPRKGARIVEKSPIVVTDYEYAFLSGLHTVDYKNLKGLPERYTARFANALRGLTPEKIATRYSDLATADEIDGLIFRRAIILKDIELRGSASLIP